MVAVIHYPTTRSHMLRKVPEITAVFWVAKLLTTALGESISDWLVNRVDPYLAVTLGGVAFVLALWIQFRAPKYRPWTYWLTAAMVAIFGTMAADGVHIQLGVPYAISSVAFAAVLAAVFITWYTAEDTLSIHTVTSGRREVFYWLTVVTTFALGTATGDLIANTFGLGYFPSGILFIAIILIPALGYWFFGLGEVAAFWSAYVITRPLGASFADWMGKPHLATGLGWGNAPVSCGLFALLVSVIAYMTFNRGEATHELPRKSIRP
jgi:uncharacterized membrane-anchored protein